MYPALVPLRQTPVSSPGLNRLECLHALRCADRSMPQLNGIGEGVATQICKIGELRRNVCASHHELLDTLRHWTGLVLTCRTHADPVLKKATASTPPKPIGVRAIDTDSPALRGSGEALSSSGDVDTDRARKQTTLIQYALEQWIGARMRSGQRGRVEKAGSPFPGEPSAFKATAVFHTPKPCTPLLVSPGRPVPSDLISPVYRSDASVVESIARRVVSVREMADAGARVVVCYPETERDNLPLSQQLAYNQACESPNIIDFPAPPSSQFKELSGATYVVGSYQSPYDVCVSIRLVQARAIQAEPCPTPQARLSADVMVRSQSAFAGAVTELQDAFGFCLDTIH